MVNFSNTDLIVFFGVLSTFCIVIASCTACRNTSIAQHLMLSRKLTLPAFVITLVSSWYSGVLGATQIAYNNGLYNFVVLGVFWYVSAVIFALLIANKLVKSGFISLPQLIGATYGKPAERLVTFLFIIKTLPIGYLMALSMILATILGLTETQSWICTSIIGIMLFSRSSFKTVLIVDTIQFILIFSTMIMVLFFSVKTLGGYEYIVTHVPSSHLTVTGAADGQKMALWFFVALSSTILSPIFHQRCFASKSGKVAKLGVLCSILFWIISDILTTVGGLYAYAHLGPGHSANAYMKLMESVLPEGLIGYAFAAMLITAISALDSHLFASKSLLGSYARYSKNKLLLPVYILMVLLSSTIAIYLDNDLERAWLLFDSAFIASLLIPSTIAIRAKNALSGTEFIVIVTSSFIITATAESIMLKDGTTSCLYALCGNAILIYICYARRRLKNVI